MMSTKNKLTISPEMSKYITEYTNKSLEKYKKTNNYNWNDFIKQKNECKCNCNCNCNLLIDTNKSFR